MKNLMYIGIIGLCLWLGLSACQAPKITQEEITSFVDEYERDAEFLNRQVALHKWTMLTGEPSDSLDYYTRVRTAFLSDPGKLSNCKKYLAAVNDDEYAEKLAIINRQLLRSVIENTQSIKNISDSLMAIAGKYAFEYEGKETDQAQLLSILKNEKNRSRRQEAFRSLHTVGDTLAAGVATLVRLRNQAAKRLGYNSYYDLMLKADDIDKTTYVAFLDEIDAITREPYRKLLDSLKGSLHLENIRIWDISYDNGLTAGLDNYFSPSTGKTLLEQSYSDIGIRLDKWPIYFYGRTTGLSHGEMLPVYIPDDIRVVYDERPGFGAVKDLFAQTGDAVYGSHIDAGDYLRTLPPAPCFEKAMGRVSELMVEQDAWLQKYAALPNPLVSEVAAFRDIQRLISLRLNLVNLNFEMRMYKDPYKDLDELYTSIFERYMLMPLDSDAGGWAAQTVYISEPVGLQNDLLATVIAAQTFSYLKQKYGSIVDNSHTREFLVQNYYRFGGAEDWRTLLDRGTGEDLNPKYLLEYCGL